MSARWRDLARLAWRDSRSARSRLLLYMSAISLGVAALVAIDSYSSNVVRSIRSQSRDLLGGDLSLSSRTVFAPAVDSLLDTLARGGIAVGRTTTFTSMALVPRAPAPRLVQVNAVGPGVPFYGAIESDPAGRYGALQQGRTVLVDDALLVELNAKLGDSLSLGSARFAVIGTLKNVPGDLSIASSLGPRVYIADRWVPETKLLVFGSRAEYTALLALPSGTDPAAVVEQHRATLDAAHVRARTVQDTERSLTFDIQQLDRFLGVVALVALLLGGVGVASAIRAYVEEKRDPIAVLRVLGADVAPGADRVSLRDRRPGARRRARRCGARRHRADGAAQSGGRDRAGDGDPAHRAARHPRRRRHRRLGRRDLRVASRFWAFRRISPLEAIRRDTAPTPVRRILSDWPRVIAGLALAASVVLIAIGRAGTVRRGVSMSARDRRGARAPRHRRRGRVARHPSRRQRPLGRLSCAKDWPTSIARRTRRAP